MPGFHKTASVHGFLLLLTGAGGNQGYNNLQITFMFCLPFLPLVKSPSDSNTTQGCMTNISSATASFPFLSKVPEAFRRASTKEQRRGSADIESPEPPCAEEGDQYLTSSVQHLARGQECWTESILESVI